MSNKAGRGTRRMDERGNTGKSGGEDASRHKAHKDKIGFSPGFGVPRVRDLLKYRKVAIAVVSSYLGLEDTFVDAVLADRMDDWLQAEAPSREQLKQEHYDEYVTLLSREIIVRYAATAAETLLVSPDPNVSRTRNRDADSLERNDDVNAVVRVHEIYEYLESPDACEGSDQILQSVKRQMCHYYHACATDLVKGQLLPVIVGAAEELYRTGELAAPRVRELIIAGQNAKPKSG